MHTKLEGLLSKSPTTLEVMTYYLVVPTGPGQLVLPCLWSQASWRVAIRVPALTLLYLLLPSPTGTLSFSLLFPPPPTPPLSVTHTNKSKRVKVPSKTWPGKAWTTSPPPPLLPKLHLAVSWSSWGLSDKIKAWFLILKIRNGFFKCRGIQCHYCFAGKEVQMNLWRFGALKCAYQCATNYPRFEGY